MRSSEFRLLVLPFSSRLYKLAFRMLGSREEAEDVVQEVYLKLWKMKDDLQRYSSIEAFCVRVTRNMCLDQLRRRDKTREIVDQKKQEQLEPQDDPEGLLIKQERADIMNKLINQLPEPQRSLVYFRHIEGKEYHEIEELMDMTENAIRVSISRARKQLKELLQKKYASWTE